MRTHSFSEAQQTKMQMQMQMQPTVAAQSKYNMQPPTLAIGELESLD
jgi:hypothetical protein